MEPNNKNYYILGAIAVAIIIGAVYLFSTPKKKGSVPLVDTTTTIVPVVSTPTTIVPVAENKEAPTISYTDMGFFPNSIEVSVGSKVTFINQSARLMWVASAVHPTHQALPGFDQLVEAPNGASYEYTFTKAGTWKYHNHLNTEAQGMVNVR